MTPRNTTAKGARQQVQWWFNSVALRSLGFLPVGQVRILLLPAIFTGRGSFFAEHHPPPYAGMDLERENKTELSAILTTAGIDHVKFNAWFREIRGSGRASC